MNARRPLADANLVTRAEARVELGCSWKAVDALLCRCRRYAVGKAPRYRWSEVLERAAEPVAPVRKRTNSRSSSIGLLEKDWM
jgi:hypothetical protein